MNPIKLEDLNLVQHPLDQNQYIAQEHPKKQIYLHHTVGGADGKRDIDNWNANRARVGTAVCISRDGTIVQAFSSKHWAYHLGLKESAFDSKGLPYVSLDKVSIGIELCSYGPLKLDKDGIFRTVYNNAIDESEIEVLDKPFRGWDKYWHKYTDAQIESVRKLLLFWGHRYNIPLEYNEDVWDVTMRALMAEPGVYTHCSVRYDKSDIYPDPRLIEMWKNL